MDLLLEKLIKTYGVSGRENKIRDVIKDKLISLGIEFKIDAMGNIITTLTKSSNKKTFALCSHMDTIGIIATYIEDNGFIRCGAIGDFNLREFQGGIAEFENGTKGRIAMEKSSDEIGDMFIDIGVSSREEALRYVEEGDVAFLKGEIIQMNNIIMGPSLNNRIGCYILLKVLENIKDIKALESSPYNITFVFTTQHNLGGRGARALTHGVMPDYALVIDGEESGDYIGSKGDLKLSEGLGMKIMDKNLIINDEIKDILEEVKEKNNIKIKKITSYSITDGGIIQREGKGCKTASMAFPCRYVNSSEEMVSLIDIEEGVKLIEGLLNIE
ncbi:M42 family peptidase [Clostridium sp.]|uniref:M42 family peptidase n=1 Tax=Clostridium sp. TaxID=1506 RepID=UPI003463F992